MSLMNPTGSPVRFWKPTVFTSGCRMYQDSHFTKLNGKTKAWVAYFVKIENQSVISLPGYQHWSSNHFEDYQVRQFEWASVNLGSRRYLAEPLETDGVYHIAVTFDGTAGPAEFPGACEIFLNGYPVGTGGSGQNSLGTTLTTSHALMRWMFGDANDNTSNNNSQYTICDFMLGVDAIPTVEQFQAIARREVEVVNGSGVPNGNAPGLTDWFEFRGTAGTDVTVGNAGIVNKVSGATWNIDTLSTNKPYFFGDALEIGEALAVVRQDCFIAPDGKIGIILLTKNADETFVEAGPWSSGAETTLRLPFTFASTGLMDVPIRVNINGGSDVKPDWIYLNNDQESGEGVATYYVFKLPTAVTAGQTVTWKAPFGWASTATLGALDVITDDPVTNRVGQNFIFEDYLAGSNSMKIGANLPFQNFLNHSCPMYADILHGHGYNMAGSDNVPFWNVTRSALPDGWHVYVGGTIGWVGGQVASYDSVPEGNYTMMWDGAVAPSISNIFNATITQVSEVITGTTNNKRVFSITRTTVDDTHMSWQAIISGSSGSQNLRFYMPGVNVDTPPKFSPHFLNKLEPLEMIRAMDNLHTNNNNLLRYSDWPTGNLACIGNDRLYGYCNVTSVTDPGDLAVVTGNWFLPLDGAAYLKVTTSTPHTFRTGQCVTINGGNVKIYFANGQNTPLYQVDRPIYVLSATEFIMFIYTGFGTSVITGTDPIPANTKTYATLMAMTPLADLVELSNLINKPLHLCLPTLMEAADYNAVFQYCADNLVPKLYCEYDNEPWNMALPFLNHVRYQSLGRINGGINQYAAYVDAAHTVHQLGRAIYAAETRSSDYIAVYGTMASVHVVTTQMTDRMIAMAIPADYISPASYWNTSMRFLPTSLKLTTEEVCSINEVCVRRQLVSGGRTLRKLLNDHLMEFRRHNPSGRMLYYEGGMTSMLIGPNPRPNLAIAAQHSPAAYGPLMASFKEMQAAGADFYNIYNLSYAYNVFTGGSTPERIYAAGWCNYVGGQQDYGRGDGSDGKLDNRTRLTYDVNGDTTFTPEDYPHTVSVSGKATLDWNASTTTVAMVVPSAVTANANAQVQFTGYNFPGAITWTASIGTINATTGLWTAPATAGTGTVTATSGATVVNVNVTVTVPSEQVTINPTSATVFVNGILQFNATGPASIGPTWSAIRGTMTPNANQAQYTAPSTVGSDTVTVTYGAISASATITVNAAPAPPSVTPSTVSVQVNAQQQFTANNFTGTVNWTTSAGTISSTGVLTAPSTAQNLVVTATSGSQSAIANVTVTAAPSGPRVDPSTATVIQGGQVQFNGANFTGAITWTQNGSSIVNPTGMFTAEYHALTNAKTVIVTGTSGAEVATATVTIPPVQITISPTGPVAQIGSIVQFTGVISNAINQTKIWSIPASTSLGSTIDQTGKLITGSTGGIVTVRLTHGENPTRYTETTVTVQSQPTALPAFYGTVNRALTTVTANRNAGQLFLDVANASVFDGPTALPSRVLSLTVTRGSTDSPVCNLECTSRSSGTRLIISRALGQDANVLVGDFVSVRWSKYNIDQIISFLQSQG